MKKVLLTAALIGSVFVATAQNAGKIYVGADLLGIDYSTALTFKLAASPNPLFGISNKSGPGSGLDKNRKSDMSWGVNVNGGYFLNENWAIGLGLGFMGSSRSDTSTAGSPAVLTEKKSSSSGIMIMPYVRYMMPLTGKWSMLIDGGLNIMMGDTKTGEESPATPTTVVTEVKTTTFGVFIRPGINYALTDRWNIVGAMGTNFLSFNSNSTETTVTPNGGTAVTTKPSNSDFAINLNPLNNLTVNFGLYYSFGGGAAK